MGTAPGGERDEARRLDALAAYGILDTAEEPAYDDIARLAALICRTPAAVVTFVDGTRQWFKAHIGLPFRESPRELAFCAHTIADTGGVLEVPDATADPRFAGNPLVTSDPSIRFYAGVPLVTPEGFAIGTLAVLDFRPGRLSAEQREALTILSRQVMAQLELRRRWRREQGASAEAEGVHAAAAARHAAMVASALDAIITMDARGVVTGFNPAAERLFGYSRDEALGQILAHLIVPPHLREAHSRGLAHYLETGQAGVLGRRLEMTALRRDGSEFDVELAVHAAGTEEAPEFIGFVRDISARVSATRQLRASEERFRLIARATHDVVWDWDIDTGTVFVPEGFQKIFGGGSDATVVGLDARLEAIHPEDRSRVRASLQAALERGDDIWSEEYRYRRSDGTYATVFDRGYVVRDAAGRATRMTGAMMDVSERRHLEAQLRQSQKLEGIGQLAGGVAHDFNNILTVIQGHASLLMGSRGLDGEAADAVQQIAEAAERAAGLTRQLLAFSRKQVLDVVDIDINRVVDGMVRLLQRVIGEHITLEISLSPSAAVVKGDAGMIEQVILNLAVNARDAMPDGGILRLRTSVEVATERSSHPAATTAGPAVRISVTDHGVGIAPDVLPHVFEPFFTTKDVDRGTGLGLATVYGIVQQHRGWVEVATRVGEGTTFDVFLPASGGAPATAPATQPESERGKGTILLVEDEAPVRRLARLVLQRHGYDVIEADCGQTALAAWRERKGVIDLLLTDMVMPSGMSGLVLARELTRDQPDLPVIVTSGYSPNLAGKELTPGIAFLPKPYTAAQLLTAVGANLGGARQKRRDHDQ